MKLYLNTPEIPLKNSFLIFVADKFAAGIFPFTNHLS